MTVATLLSKVDPYRPIIYGVLAADAAYQECAARVLRLKGWYNSSRQ